MEREHEGNALYRDIMRRLFLINHLHHASIDSRADRLGLHRSQHMMLTMISMSGEPLTQKEISERLDISPAAVAVTLRKLIAGGYVCRSQDEGDARCNNVSITAEGRRVLEETREIFDSVDATVFSGFSEGELSSLKEMLDRMRANLKRIAPADALEHHHHPPV